MNTNPLTIIHLVPARSWGGGEQYAFDLACAQARMGHAVTAVCRPGRIVAPRFADAGIATRTMPLAGATDFISPLRLAAMLRGAGPVTVHAHNFKGAIAAVRARRLSRNPDVHIVVTRHLVRPAKTSAFYRRLYSSIDRIIFVSELARSRFVSTLPDYPMGKTVVVHNGVICPVAATQNTIAGAPVLMFHGRIAPEKGIDTIIKAMPRMADMGVRLIIAGTGDTAYVQSLRQLADSLGVAGQIEWAGFVRDIHPLIDRANIGVFPSRGEESFGLALVEYMAHGRPVVSTATGAQTEIITDVREGLIIPHDNSEALAAAVRRIVATPGLLPTLSANAAATFAARFAYPRFLQAIMSHYPH